MATLTADSPRVFETGHDEYLSEIPLTASTKIFAGAAVGLSSSLARPLQAADPFGGFCTEYCDSTVATNPAIPTPGYALRVKVKSKGVAKLLVVGVTGVTNEGATVYASDDATFTLTSTSNTAIGKILRYETGTSCLVAFDSLRTQSL
jgi:hypothetical protein